MTDLIIVNGVIRTQDSHRPVAEALAITGNRLTAVGGNHEIRALAGRGTRILDAEGQLVLPGFNDAHVHFLAGGFQLSSVDLRDAATSAEFARRIAAFAGQHPEVDWITGGSWDHERWPGAPLPDRDLIDAATPDRPVFVSRLDCHMALANGCALRLAGINRNTRDPDGGQILRDPRTGEPTGLLKDAAMSLVNRAIPAPTFEARLAAARAATDHAARCGVTSVQDMSAGPDVKVYQTLLQRGECRTRIYGLWPLPRWQEVAVLGIGAGFGSEWLRVGGLKGFSDGSLGSGTALFFEPYNDAPDACGLPADEMFPPGAMQQRVIGADQAGLQLIIHAIGDRANHEVLAIFETAMRENGNRDRRWRIEHAQHLRPEDIARFARAGVIASVQPYHAADDGRWAARRIGSERCRQAYAFRSMLDGGVTLALGTDWTVAPLDPLATIAAAVTRRTLDGRNPDGWIPEQKITVEEAVRAYTVGSAFAEFQERVKGTLTPGKLADLVFLSEDIFELPPAEIPRARVTRTIVDGRIVHEACAS